MYNDRDMVNAIDTITDIVVLIRNELECIHDTSDVSSIYYRYDGLCEVASNMVIDKCSKLKASMKGYTITVAQKKHPRIHSSKWSCAHVICVIIYRNIEIYVDATSSRFGEMYPGIPDFIVSVEKPRWYLMDDDMCINSMTTMKSLNDIVSIKYHRHIDGIKFPMDVGLIEYAQYSILGKLSNIINTMFYKRNR